MNKKGAEMTIGTIIAITLGVALLVFLIYGFSTQWKTFQGTITPLTGDSNVDDIRRGCEVACTSNNVYAYCSQKRVVEFGKDADPLSEEGNCTSLEGTLGITCNIC